MRKTSSSSSKLLRHIKLVHMFSKVLEYILLLHIVSLAACEYMNVSYFAYGSNLLAKRIHINVPNATRYAIGHIKDHRIDFLTQSDRWKGAVATIIPTNGSDVWGAIWKISEEDVGALDRQEGVSEGLYVPLDVDVVVNNGTIRCRSYKQTVDPAFVDLQDLPASRRPSAIYLRTIVAGAKESKLPEEYVRFLSNIPNNGNNNSELDQELDDLNEIVVT